MDQTFRVETTRANASVRRNPLQFPLNKVAGMQPVAFIKHEFLVVHAILRGKP
jgi:hypothetical protein